MNAFPIAIGIGLAVPGLLLVLLIWSQRRDNKRIGTTDVPGLGAIREYRNRLECAADGPWGSSTFTSFDKIAKATFAKKASAFRDGYDQIKSAVDAAVRVAAGPVGQTIQCWIISDINVDGPENDYSLIIDVPDCKEITWGIGVELRDKKVLEWNLLH